MGLTQVTTRLISLTDPKLFYENIFLVDTGAPDSMAPGHELEKLGIRKEGRMSNELADGTVKEYPLKLMTLGR